MLRMLSARRMCLCHTVNHTIYIIERRGGFARRDGVHGGKSAAGCYLLSGAVARACGQIHRHRARRREHAARRRMDAMEWTHRAGDSGIPRVATARATCRQRRAAGPARRPPLALPVPFRGPDSGELRTCTCRPVPWARRDTYLICRCVALTGISHTRAGLRRKPGRDGRRNI